MAIILSHMFAAFRKAGVPEELAEAAAEEPVAFALNSLWWNPGERRERRGARLTRRVREEYRVYFDRNATQSAA